MRAVTELEDWVISVSEANVRKVFYCGWVPAVFQGAFLEHAKNIWLASTLTVIFTSLCPSL